MPKKDKGENHDIPISSNDPNHPQKKVAVNIKITDDEGKKRLGTLGRSVPLIFMCLLIGLLGAGATYLLSDECSKKDIGIAIDVS